ncbi:DoxX family protein [Rhodococcoides corynebacterioides]|uniref:Cytoplasmic membrane protein FsxA n=1 Tax=Rhodococcoides corynebacterioides TaxID=53972 RepID=A0ABS7P0N1_9NOCA|nr:hypothetical protein [Rhodococcus corynebacterioides]MBY6365955.1 hypothetical protein [Rhodococcus corynebacterioides]MBY6409115.1 hypothetical protein [Rhodococcus corynebacterioides]
MTRLARRRPRSRRSDAAAARLTVLLGGAGVLHFVAPAPFDAQVPRALPGSARTYTYVSGVAEVALAAGLAAPRTRRLSGAAAAAFFVAVFPANVNMAVLWWRSSRTSTVQKVGVLLRLPLQIPLVTQAWSVYSARR